MAVFIPVFLVIDGAWPLLTVRPHLLLIDIA